MLSPGSGAPDLSIIVVAYNIPRELPRTLVSLSTRYQRHIDAEDYEVIVVDNGSSPPVNSELLAQFGAQFRLITVENASQSPARAINLGIATARGSIVGLMVDGARIATPGLCHFARHGANLYPAAVVATLGWYLGYDYQRWSMRYGYDQAREDALLESIGWPEDGYRLFDIGTMDESSTEGWFFPIAESNALFMRREMWAQLGGVEERFAAPGGGLINLDTFARTLALPDAQVVIPLGEATFHQLHGGVATNCAAEDMPAKFREWDDEYAEIRGHRFQFAARHMPTYIGTLPRPALSHFLRAGISPVRSYPDRPLGNAFGRDLWTVGPSHPPSDDRIAAAMTLLAQQAFRSGHIPAVVSIARLIRGRFPEEPEAQRLLTLTAGGLEHDHPLDAEYFRLIGEAHRILGEYAAAEAHFQQALSLDSDYAGAHLGLSSLRLPGEDYLAWLGRLYMTLRPKTVIEIGVFEGASLALVRPPSRAIGIDPKPRVIFPLSAETHIFTETSDEFFSRGGANPLLDGQPLSIGFIDGLHSYEQCLKDFIQLEALCGRHSLIFLHDTFPLDERTQSRHQHTRFYTGDVWRIVLALKEFRPDLDVFTIATPPTGLTVVAGFNPGSSTFEWKYEDVVARFVDTPFSEFQKDIQAALNIVPNDWAIVEGRLKQHGIL